MATWTFTLRLNREPTDAELDALFEAGCDDSAPEGSLLHFDREADTLLHAVWSAARDVSTVADLRALGVMRHDLASLREVAVWLDRTYESVRLLAEGKRGPGGFPTPVVDNPAGRLYSWKEVVDWSIVHLDVEVEIEHGRHQLAVADAVLTLHGQLSDVSSAERDEVLSLLRT